MEGELLLWGVLVSYQACHNSPSLVLLIFVCVKKSFAERCYAQIFCLVKNQDYVDLTVISGLKRHSSCFLNE
jgi:hypothetical protein